MKFKINEMVNCLEERRNENLGSPKEHWKRYQKWSLLLEMNRWNGQPDDNDESITNKAIGNQLLGEPSTSRSESWIQHRYWKIVGTERDNQWGRNGKELNLVSNGENGRQERFLEWEGQEKGEKERGRRTWSLVDNSMSLRRNSFLYSLFSSTKERENETIHTHGHHAGSPV